MNARTSRSGLLPSSVVCGDDVDISSILRQNGPKRHSIGGYSNIAEEKAGALAAAAPPLGASSTPLSRQPLSAVPRGLANGERSSDSEDSRSGSGATSGKEASPGYEESSGSEQSSGAPNTDEGRPEESANFDNISIGGLNRLSIPRSRTSPALNGGWGIDDALKPLSQFTPDSTVGNGDVRANKNSIGRMRVAHEVNISKLAYLEALFQRAKLEEMRLKGLSSKPKSEEKLIDDQSAKATSPDSGYKSFPPQTNPTIKSSISGPSLSTIAQSPGDVSIPDGQALLRTIENRLHQARSQDPSEGRKNFYQTGGSCSVGSLSVLMNQPIVHSQSASSTPARFPSPSRPIDAASNPLAVSTTSSSIPPGNPIKRPDGLGSRLTLGQGMPKSLPHNYRSRSAYSSPAVSPQRGPDPVMLISPSIAASVNKRFSSLETRGREEKRGLLRNLPLRHTAHGFPINVLPISPPSPAQGAQALQRKMMLFLEIMETQAKFSKDLQSEIESHKDVLASLNATGQKLLGTLENQDEALLLHRRLGEMNHRWNTLKYKSIAIRNRLEGTAENWNSLLLSLRELIEWVIRKDTELTAMGPLVGDVNMLAKYENDLAIFRRGLDEKQPVIESNLKSGRQLIASEPPLSDTSDSEAGREVDGDARYRGEESTRDLTRSVRREVTKLSEKWAALWERAANLAAQVSLAHKVRKKESLSHTQGKVHNTGTNTIKN